MSEPINLPLKITDDNRAGDIYLGTAGAKRMIMVFFQLPGGMQAKVIAEYIVRACNSRKDLVTACAKAHDALLSLHICNQDNSFASEIRTLLKAAIEKAEIK